MERNGPTNIVHRSALNSRHSYGMYGGGEYNLQETDSFLISRRVCTMRETPWSKGRTSCCYFDIAPRGVDSSIRRVACGIPSYHWKTGFPILSPPTLLLSNHLAARSTVISHREHFPVLLKMGKVFFPSCIWQFGYQRRPKLRVLGCILRHC